MTVETKQRADATFQPKHANLTALAGLSGLADRLAYFTGAGAMALATLTAQGRTLIEATLLKWDETNKRLGIGTASPADKLHVSATGDGNAVRVVDGTGNTMLGTATDIGTYGGAKLQVRQSGSANTRWYGRIVAGGDQAVFLMGQWNSAAGVKRAWLGAHTGDLGSWLDFYVNPAANSGTVLHLGCTTAGDGNTILAVSNVANGARIGPAGTYLTQAKVYTPSLTPASVAANTTAEQTFAVTGLTTADTVAVTVPGLVAGIGLMGARVSAADTLALTFGNLTAGALTPPAGVYRVLAIRS